MRSTGNEWGDRPRGLKEDVCVVSTQQFFGGLCIFRHFPSSTNAMDPFEPKIDLGQWDVIEVADIVAIFGQDRAVAAVVVRAPLADNAMQQEEARADLSDTDSPWSQEASYTEHCPSTGDVVDELYTELSGGGPEEEGDLDLPLVWPNVSDSNKRSLETLYTTWQLSAPATGRFGVKAVMKRQGYSVAKINLLVKVRRMAKNRAYTKKYEAKKYRENRIKKPSKKT